MNKMCSKCGETKPLEQFGKRKSSPDGRRGVCKPCRNAQQANEAHRAYQREYNKSEKGKAVMLRWYYSEKGSEAAKRWRESEKGKAYQEWWNANHRREYDVEYYRNKPQEREVTTAVAVAIRSGKLAHPSTLSCSKCGQPADQYHHESYAPEHFLDVVPYCRCCHRTLHRDRRRQSIMAQIEAQGL